MLLHVTLMSELITCCHHGIHSQVDRHALDTYGLSITQRHQSFEDPIKFHWHDDALETGPVEMAPLYLSIRN